MYAPLLFALLSCAIAAPVIELKDSDLIAGKWIVKLKGDVTSFAENELKASISTKPDFDYSMTGFRGFAGTLSDEELTLLQASEHVGFDSVSETRTLTCVGRIHRARRKSSYVGHCSAEKRHVGLGSYFSH
jgi:hypothetical protein